MSDGQNVFSIKNAPANLDFSVQALVSIPSFNKVKAHADSSQSVVIGYITLSVSPVADAQATYVDLELDTIRDVTYDSEAGEYSFTGRRVVSPVRFAKRSEQVAHSTPTYYKVTVRGQLMAHMYVIENPHP